MIVQVRSNKYGDVDFLIDETDWVEFQHYRFYAWGSKRHHGLYLMAYKPGDWKRAHRVHRLIMKAKPGEIVDHISGDTQDNRRENLRITSTLVNNQNARKRKDGVTSAFKGVSWDKRSELWKAQIQVQGHKKALGYFETEFDAALAYDTACAKFGVQGKRNISDIQWIAHCMSLDGN